MLGILVCQECNETIDHFEDEKVTVLYGKCNCCCDDKQPKEEQRID